MTKNISGLIVVLLLLLGTACEKSPPPPQQAEPGSATEASQSSEPSVSAQQPAPPKRSQSLEKLETSDFIKPDDLDHFPTIEEFSAYLQSNIDYNGARTDGGIEYCRWEWDDDSTGVTKTDRYGSYYMLAYPVVASGADNWGYYGVHIYSGQLYRWKNGPEERPERVDAREIFTTPLSALEYVKAHFVDVDVDSPYVYELSYEQDGMPYYKSQTIYPDEDEEERNFTGFITIDRRGYDDRYIVHVFTMMMLSPDEGHTATSYWIVVHKGGFVKDDIIPNSWIVSEPD